MNSSAQSRIFSIALLLLRFVLCVWVGAAALYVITSVAEQTSPHFDTATRDLLATVRFPLYYKFGFIAHIIAGTFGFLAWRAALPENRRRMLIILGLVTLSALLIFLDFRLIYQPLQELINPPGQPRGDEFVKMHNRSKYANEVHVSLICLAAFLACWPVGSNNKASSTDYAF